jgi:hypothetical protein
MRHALVLTAALASAVVMQAAAQRPNTREGFWIGAGLGDASVGVDCYDCRTDRYAGFSGLVKAGGTLSRHVLLGGELAGWTHSGSGYDEHLGFADVIATIYPSAAGAFFLEVGVGGMSYKYTDAYANEVTATAPAGTLGAGYDFRVGENLSVTPYLNFFASNPARFTYNGVRVPTGEDIKLNMSQIGVGLTWH